MPTTILDVILLALTLVAAAPLVIGVVLILPRRRKGASQTESHRR